MGQEPGTAEEIQTFCSTTYGVTFPLLAKTDVNGAGPASAVRRTDQDRPTPAARPATCSGISRSSCSHPMGEVVNRFRPRTVPDAPEVIERHRSGFAAITERQLKSRRVGNRQDTWRCHTARRGWTTDRLGLRDQRPHAAATSTRSAPAGDARCAGVFSGGAAAQGWIPVGSRRADGRVAGGPAPSAVTPSCCTASTRRRRRSGVASSRLCLRTRRTCG